MVSRWIRSSAVARYAVVSALCGALPTTAAAQSVPRDLRGATLEELMNIRVTTAARKEQRLEDIAAAVFVITSDDIRRSGLTTLPELFRLVPGMQVAHINANKWAVSVRGFNDLYSNKLLVLIDGRSIYNRAFGGVYWDTHDLLISDIERIEVIRGPGGAVWGANAMNGVINIVTRSAADTQGTLVETSVGTFERNRAAVRHGGRLGELRYRVYSQWSDYDDARLADGSSANDRWTSFMGGSRVDWSRGVNQLMLQVNGSTSESLPNYTFINRLAVGALPELSERSDVDDVNVLGRWTRSNDDGSQLIVQAYHWATYRNETPIWHNEQTSDVDAQYQRAFGARHDVVFGGGVRHAVLSTRGTVAVDIPPGANDVVNVFVQDDITLGRVNVLLGSKLEHDTAASWGWLPSARVMWNATSGQHVWGAISKARRTPAAFERDLRLNVAVLPGNPLPIVAGLVGNPDYVSEELIEAELGYRLRLGSNAEVEVTGFRGAYTNLLTSEPQAPVVELTPIPHVFVPAMMSNMLDLQMAGVEVTARWAPSDIWRVSGSYSGVDVNPRLRASSQDLGPETNDTNASPHQWQVRSSLTPTRRTQFDVALYRVAGLRRLEVPAYSRLDGRVELALSKRLSAIVTGQNLLRSTHQEFAGTNSMLRESLVPRSARLQLRWQF